MEKKRILVVDDSPFMRRLIRTMVESDPEFEVVGTASNGSEAVLFNKRLLPNAITLDVEMPIMNGLEALKMMMKERPVPVIMLSSLTKDGAKTTIEAMMHGAVDYMEKPSGAVSIDLEILRENLLAKLRVATTAKVVLRGQTNDLRKPEKKSFPKGKIKHPTLRQVVCIGSSTGGPRALETVISNLPSELPVPVLVVQHMPAHFTATLASRLNQASKINVKEAEQGERLQGGTVYIAPGGIHMKVEERGEALFIQLDDSPPVKGLKPCFDRLLESMIPLNCKVVYTVLTGMGADGSAGLMKIKECLQVYAIAESEKTSIIYGMPKAASKTGLIDKVVDLEGVSQEIVNQIL